MKTRHRSRRKTNNEPSSYEKIDIENIKYLYPTQIDSLLKKNDDQKLNDIVSIFVKFKKDEQQMIMNNISIPYYDFKKTLFKQVELLLCQINEIDNQTERKKSIEKLYKWYKNKTKFYYTLNRMNEKSYFEPYEKYDFNVIKNILKDEKKDDEEEDKNENKDKKNANIHKPILLRRIKLIKIIENDIKPSKFYFKNKFGKNRSELNLVNSKKIKYDKNTSTEFERLKKNISTTSIDFNLNELKNKFLAEKSNQNEIKSIIEDFGKSRAIYKSNLNKKFEMKKIIKEYKNIKNKNIKNEQVIKISNNNQSSINISNIENNNNNTIGNSNNNDNTIENTNEVKKQDDNLDNNSLEYIINEKEMNNLENEKEKSQIETHKRKLNKIITNKIKNMSSDNLLISSTNKCNNENDRYENKSRYIENSNRTKSALFLTSTEIYKDKEPNKEGLEEKTINIYFQFPKIKSSNALISKKSHKNDTIMRNICLDPIFRAKHQNSFLCSINDDKLNEKKKNIDSDNSYTNINDNNDSNIRYNILNMNNISEFTKKTLSESIDKNYLNMKKGFDFLKKKEFLKLRNLMKSKQNYECVNKSALITAFTNPKNNTIYPSYFLPLNNGNNLLIKPIAK